MYDEIFFCSNNVSKGLDPLITKLEQEYPDVEIYIEDCLGHCYQCRDEFYCVIGADPIGAKTPQQLYKAIEQVLESRRLLFEEE